MERFQGQFKDDKRHGKGTCIYPDGSRYTGDWAAGAIQGEGRYEHANGDVFVGALSNGHRVHGKLTWSGGDEYDGEFVADVPSGEGTMHYVSEEIVHSGQWQRGTPHGKGERRELFAGGAIRRGEFEGADLHGTGVEVLPGGVVGRLVAERYDGHFERGERHGLGCVQVGTTPAWTGEWVRSWRGEWDHGEPTRSCEELIEKLDGDHEVVYSGGWAHGTRHGHGTQLERPSGRTYDGEWHRGHKEGRGSEMDPPEGVVYVGDFLAGRRHGHGRVRRPDGWRFEGQFAVGSQRGEGTLTLPPTPSGDDAEGRDMPDLVALLKLEETAFADRDGSEDEFGVAEAVDGVHGSTFVNFELLHGEGLRTYANGDAYEGGLHRTMPSGEGTMLFADGGSLQGGRWIEGFAEGDAVVTNATGDVYTGPVRASLPSGVGSWRGSDGARYEGSFANGLRHGHGKLTLADGSVREGAWEDGELHGHGESTAPDGTRYTGEFARGLRHGRGLARSADGAVYDGEWHEGMRSGEGAWLAPASVKAAAAAAAAASSGAQSSGGVDPPIKYNGQWRADHMVGHGSLVYASGASYVGSFDEEEIYDGDGASAGLDPPTSRSSPPSSHPCSPLASPVCSSQGRRSKPLSAGRYVAAPGSTLSYTYGGQWCHGVRNGRGAGVEADGSSYEGEWRDGVRNGRGRLTTRHGDVWDGPVEDGAMVSDWRS